MRGCDGVLHAAGYLGRAAVIRALLLTGMEFTDEHQGLMAAGAALCIFLGMWVAS